MTRLFSQTPAEVSVYQGYVNEWMSGLAPYRDYWFEYPPGVLLLGRIPYFFSHNPNHYFALWLCMILAALVITYISLGKKSIWIIAAAFAGGILTTHRFDIFVTILVALALEANKQNKRFSATALLTFGVFTKIYPIIPLVLLFLFRPVRDYKRLVAGVLAVAIPMLYIWYPGISRFIEFHGEKPVQIESTVIPQNPGAVSYERFSWVHHATSADISKQAVFTVVGIIAILLAKKYSNYETASYIGVLTFVLSGNIFSPQYMLWLASFLPYISMHIGIVTILLTGLTSFYFQYYEAIIQGLRPEKTLLEVRNWALIRIQSVLAIVYLFKFLSSKKWR